MRLKVISFPLFNGVVLNVGAVQPTEGSRENRGIMAYPRSFAPPEKRLRSA
jgi:hypothetical protein